MHRYALPLLAAMFTVFLITGRDASADPHNRPSQGELSGKRLFVSAGHGYYWHSSLGWITQRGVTHGVVEDHSNAMLMIDYIIPYLTNAGATVVAARERSYETLEFIGDDGGAGHSETGSWTTSTNVSGFYGSGYRWAATSSTETAVSSWSFSVPREARLPVYVWFTSGTDRAPDALYRVHHAAGITEVLVNQTNFTHTDYASTTNTHNEGGRWVYLGEWEFNSSQPAVIELSNQSSAAGAVVIADAVRVGAGMGSIDRGGGVSGRARWEECSRYWAEYVGAPVSVYNSSGTGEDNGDDVTARPRLMNWWGGFDLYFALHSNASTGAARGTVTLSYDNSGGVTHPASLIALSNGFRDDMNAQVAGDMTTLHDSTWVTRTPYGGNFGELRMSTTAPSCLLESAFHDNVTDASYLRDPKARHTIGRAVYKAIVRYFDANATIIPLPPTHMRMVNTGTGEVTISWQAQNDPLESSAVPTGYRVYLSNDGFAFDDGTPANGATSHVLTGLAPGQTVFARVTATNAGGESLVSEMMCARTPDAQAQGLATPLLIVSGYDRLDEFTWYQQGATVHTGDMHVRNTRDSVRRHALAAAAATTTAGGTFFFDGASNEAVENGSIGLAGYAIVDWVLGNESTQDETFSATEQTLVTGYLNGGGKLFVSGSEIGWDLDSQGTASDQAFYNGVLGTDYVADDSNDYTVDAVAGRLFDGVPSFSFDDGSGNSYTVGYPDVIQPAAGGSALSVLQYSAGNAAGVATAEVVVLGFPFETINEGSARDAIMQAVLRSLASGYTGINSNPGGGGNGSGGGGGDDDSGCVVAAGGAAPGVLMLLGFIAWRKRRD